MKNNQAIGIVIHGGAATITRQTMPPKLEQLYIENLSESVNAGYRILEQGGTSLQAIEEAIKIMEDFPYYNAGKGSNLTYEKTREMDASIMEGNQLKAGAVASVKSIKNPISAARCVMTQTPHVLIVGQNAEKLAQQEWGLEIKDSSYFDTDIEFDIFENSVKHEKKENQTLQQQQNKDQSQIEQVIQDSTSEQENQTISTNNINNNKFGTVGACAVDKFGNVAAGNSTGGPPNKLCGRIGDSPIIGSGIYANNKTCAVACTGKGEDFMRTVAAFQISALMEYKQMNVEDAANYFIYEKIIKDLNGSGGCICIDTQANIAMPFNTPGMFRGYRTSKENQNTAKVFMFKD